MKAWTWQEVRDKIQRSLDLQENKGITNEDLLDWCNEAIDEAEALIHNLFQDYFFTDNSDDPIDLVADQSDYDLPSDIFAQRIRYLHFNDGTDSYKIEKASDDDIARLTERNSTYEEHFHCYRVINSTSGGVKVRLFPTPDRSITDAITIYYIRNAKEITATTDELDIPEFMNFIMQYIRVRAYEKDIGNPMLQKAMMDLERERNIMVNVLSTHTDDGVDKIEPDLGDYFEHT